MTLDHAASIFAAAITRGSARTADRAGRQAVRGTVTRAEPLEVDLHGVDLTLDADDLTITDELAADLAVGWLLTLVEVAEGDFDVVRAVPPGA